jgi:hypothetical protein
VWRADGEAHRLISYREQPGLGEHSWIYEANRVHRPRKSRSWYEPGNRRRADIVAAGDVGKRLALVRRLIASQVPIRSDRHHAGYRSLKPQRPLNRALRFLPARQLLDIRHPALEVRVVVER